jgi:shikimate kinase
MTDAAPHILTPRRNLVLIGYRASGKTMVGREVARRLGRPFVDLDQVLVTEAGESIAAMVTREGWAEFRRREKALVARFAAMLGQVLAPGGGVVLDPENVRMLRTHGVVVWLTAAAPILRERLGQDGATAANRPGLIAADPLAEVEHVLREREPLYRQAADLVVDTTTLSLNEVADRILQAVTGGQ